MTSIPTPFSWESPSPPPWDKGTSLQLLVVDRAAVNRPFPCSPGPLFQNEGSYSAFDMKIIFHSHANKTQFPKKGCAPTILAKNP